MDSKPVEKVRISFEIEKPVADAFGFLGFVGSIELFAQTLLYTRIQDLLKQMSEQKSVQQEE